MARIIKTKHIHASGKPSDCIVNLGLITVAHEGEQEGTTIIAVGGHYDVLCIDWKDFKKLMLSNENQKTR